MTRTRGLNTLQYCQFPITPIHRTITEVDEIPPSYHHDEWTINPLSEGGYDWLLTDPPVAVGDVTLTLTARAPFVLCSSGVSVKFGPILSAPPEDDIVDAWACTCPGDCPFDCVDTAPVVVVIPLQTWLDRFDGTLYMLATYDTFGSCAPSDEYLKVEVDFMNDTDVGIPVTTEDEDFVPYHGWVTHHNTLCGNQEGVLSKAVGQWRVDPHLGTLVCYHEAYAHSSEGGLCGINLYNPDDDTDEEYDLCHGAVLQQRIEGMILRSWTSPGCVSA